MPSPLILQLTSFWHQPGTTTTKTWLGNGDWDVAQFEWYRWSTGTRSGKLDTSSPSEPELLLWSTGASGRVLNGNATATTQSAVQTVTVVNFGVAAQRTSSLAVLKLTA